MIAFAKDFLRKRHRAHIPIGRPVDTVIHTGSSRERIDAVIGYDRRILKLIIHTRWRSPRTTYRF